MKRLQEVVKTFKKRVKLSKNVLFKEVKLFRMKKRKFYKYLENFLKEYIKEKPHL